MEQSKEINNNIFISAFAGVILLIVSMALSLVTTKGGHGNEVPYVLFSVLSGISAVGLLGYSVKKDKERLTAQ